MMMQKQPYSLEDGDELIVADVTYVIIDGEIIEKDERSPIEIRLDELEARIKALEMQASWSPYIYPYTDHNTQPNYAPWSSGWNPNYPGTVPDTTYPPYTIWTGMDDTDFVASDSPVEVEQD
jgi:hypothetical protein